MIRLFYDDAGNITNQYSNSKYAPSTGTYIDVDREKIKINEYKVDLVTKELVHTGTVPTLTLQDLRASAISLPPTIDQQRIEAYGPIGDQLDTLWHDIDAGKFGDAAKTSQWYQNISTVKSDIPKP